MVVHSFFCCKKLIRICCWENIAYISRDLLFLYLGWIYLEAKSYYCYRYLRAPLLEKGRFIKAFLFSGCLQGWSYLFRVTSLPHSDSFSMQCFDSFACPFCCTFTPCWGYDASVMHYLQSVLECVMQTHLCVRVSGRVSVGFNCRNM